MPLTWILTIYASALFFGVTAFMVRRRPAPWLSAYLFACVPAGIVWANQMWITSRWLRPFLLCLQGMAVIEAIGLMHRDCWRPQRRYWLAGFCAVSMIADTFWLSGYPGYPKVLWWAQMWLEVSAVASCGATLACFRWWRDFQPEGWTIGNVAVMGLYCWIELVAMVYPVTPENWVGIDVMLALVQDCCLLWWCLLYAKDGDEHSPLSTF